MWEGLQSAASSQRMLGNFLRPSKRQLTKISPSLLSPPSPLFPLLSSHSQMRRRDGVSVWRGWLCRRLRDGEESPKRRKVFLLFSFYSSLSFPFSLFLSFVLSFSYNTQLMPCHTHAHIHSFWWWFLSSKEPEGDAELEKAVDRVDEGFLEGVSTNRILVVFAIVLVFNMITLVTYALPKLEQFVFPYFEPYVTSLLECLPSKSWRGWRLGEVVCRSFLSAELENVRAQLQGSLGLRDLKMNKMKSLVQLVDGRLCNHPSVNHSKMYKTVLKADVYRWRVSLTCIFLIGSI